MLYALRLVVSLRYFQPPGFRGEAIDASALSAAKLQIAKNLWESMGSDDLSQVRKPRLFQVGLVHWIPDRYGGRPLRMEESARRECVKIADDCLDHLPESKVLRAGNTLGV